MEKTAKITEILSFSSKTKAFLHKINPYRKLNVIEEDGKIVEPTWFLYYAPFTQWFIDVLLNGFMSNFILSMWGFQQFHILYSLANGLGIWLGWKLLTKLYGHYVTGQVTIVRNQG